MTPEELARLLPNSEKPVFTAITTNMFSSNNDDRTLIYGYTTDRETFHVYSQNGAVLIAVYGLHTAAWEVTPTDFQSYVPNKRIYPETADYEFCSYLERNGAHLSFTLFGTVGRPSGGGYWGRTL